MASMQQEQTSGMRLRAWLLCTLIANTTSSYAQRSPGCARYLLTFDKASGPEVIVALCPGTAPGGPVQRRTFILPQPFSPPGYRSSTETPGVHHGPADSSSMASSATRSRISPPATSPRAQVARQYLQRGQPSGARNPMDMPNEAPIGGDLNLDDETVQRRRSSAIRHMARVYRRLMASELVQEAEDLNVIFSLRYGEE
ncbi:hypothetical protein LTR09_001286 [Extremus antarcticus]|uniref:Uncharacterized protein n=1 Tax=Extremus antarcticus TaxID=702011 RepID=A0AAJ0LWV4_9PEZI|nr:hypothetical protein LTR09_001286 [Extremus antarcticus]